MNWKYFTEKGENYRNPGIIKNWDLISGFIILMIMCLWVIFFLILSFFFYKVVEIMYFHHRDLRTKLGALHEGHRSGTQRQGHLWSLIELLSSYCWNPLDHNWKSSWHQIRQKNAHPILTLYHPNQLKIATLSAGIFFDLSYENCLLDESS